MHLGHTVVSILAVLAILATVSCGQAPLERQVVIYTSVDQVFSEPVLKEFERNTGIKVLPVYDVEAAKTTGLVNRLIAEKDRPRADVFWNGEFAQTIVLKQKGVLQIYRSSSAADIPDQYRDSDGLWTGFGGRARVLLVNRDLVKETDYPRSIFELVEKDLPGSRIGIAYPLFGTTATHAAALYALLGADEGKAFFQQLKDKGTQVVDGNSVVRDMVVSGKLAMGLTDTDDAYSAIQRGAKVDVVFLDQGEDGFGTLIIPNTVAMIQGAPHPEEARQFIDYLVSASTERLLLESGWIDLTVRPIKGTEGRVDDVNVKAMKVQFDDIFQQMERAKQELAEVFIL